jgi:hypothetical protein
MLADDIFNAGKSLEEHTGTATPPTLHHGREKTATVKCSSPRGMQSWPNRCHAQRRFGHESRTYNYCKTRADVVVPRSGQREAAP